MYLVSAMNIRGIGVDDVCICFHVLRDLDFDQLSEANAVKWDMEALHKIGGGYRDLQ